MDKMNKQKVSKLTDRYYSEYELHKFVDKFLRKYKWIPQKDYDDFYSVANYYFIEAANDFDGTGNFKGYLKMVLAKKLSSYARGMQRQKRCDVKIEIVDGEKRETHYSTLSFDAPIDSEEGSETLGDITPSKFNLEENTSEEIGLLFSSDVSAYLKKLPTKTRKIAMLISDGYEPYDIIEKMHMEEKEYQIHMDIIRTYEYRKPMEWRYI